MDKTSKKIDKAIREMEVPASLDTAIIKVKKMTDELKKGDKSKRAAGLKGGGISQRGLGRAFMKGGKA
jgi:hypothetical protein